MTSIWDQTIRIITVGDRIKSTVKNFRKDYPYYPYLIKISKLEKGEVYLPEESDMMVIILASNEETDSVILSAQVAHNKGKLTLIITTNPFDSYKNICDGWAIATDREMDTVVETLLLTIIGGGTTGLDQSEWVSCLYGCGKFLTIYLCEKQLEDGLDYIVSRLDKCLFDNTLNVDRLLFVLYFNFSEWSHIQEYKLCAVKEYLEGLPDTINVQWQTAIDDTILSDGIKITAIATFKG